MFNADLSGQVAVITGGGRGIGRASARALAKAGADIAICARTANEIDALAEELRSYGRKVVASVTDVSDWESGMRLRGPGRARLSRGTRPAEQRGRQRSAGRRCGERSRRMEEDRRNQPVRDLPRDTRLRRADEVGRQDHQRRFRYGA